MKRPFLLLSALLMLFLFTSCACAQTEDSFSYTVKENEARITAYIGSSCELILPDTLGGYPVTSIGVCAFRDCDFLQQVTIPDGITRICSNAFQNCSSLRQLLIPDSVT